MALFVTQPEIFETVGNLALDRTEPVASALALVDEVRALVSAEDLAAVLAPCESAGVHGQASRPNRDLAWHKSLFARACWEMARDRDCSLSDAVALVAIQDDRRWKLAPMQARNYGNVRRWIGKLGKARNGVPSWGNYGALVKGHGGGRKLNLDPGFARAFFELYLSQKKAGVKQTWRAVCVEYRRRGLGTELPSYDTMSSYVREKAPADVIAKYRSRKGEWADSWMGYVRRYVNCEVGDWIFGDHRVMDVWVRVCNDQGEWVAARPYFTAWADARSGFITAAVIYAAENPSHRTILDAFLLHIRRCGNRLPRGVYTDNGKDFLKHGFAKPVRLSRKRGQEVLADRHQRPYDYCILDALGVELKLAAPYNGKEKPVERWFRDHATDWERFQVGYCGNKPENRPDRKQTWGGDVMRLPTVGMAQESFNDWLETTGQQHMREDGRTRAQMWEEAELSHLVQLEEADLQYRMLLPDGTARLVGRTGYGPGIRFDGWQYGHAALGRFWEKPMMVKTMWRMPTVRVQATTRSRGKVWREVPAGIFVFTPEDVFVAFCPAVRQVGMFAEAEELELLGEIKHVINAIGAQATAGFEELTGRRQVQNDPQRVLQMIGEGETDGRQVTGIVEVSEYEEVRRTRRLKGERRTSNIEHRTSNGEGMGEDEARELAEFEENMLIGNATDVDELAEDDGMDMAEFEAAMNRGRQQEGEDYEW